MFNDINYALIESKRPPMYTAMKYWGKKPHNIWNEYIKAYTIDDGVVLDPFAGSAIAAFEAVKNGKKGIAFDLNPLTAFIIEVYATPFEKDIFERSVQNTVQKIENNPLYRKFFLTTCDKCGCNEAILQHTKWNQNTVYEVGVLCPACEKKYISAPTDDQLQTISAMDSIQLNAYVPNDIFYDSPSFTDSFIKNIGGNKFSDIWTRRNLYVLSEIFNNILQEKNETIKKQLLFGFIQSVHLCSKMCVPRNEKSNRGFSTSWGRSAYICSKKQMEMNPLLLFKNNCLGKQSVESALENVKNHIGKVPIIKDVADKADSTNEYDILYGIVDIKNIDKYLAASSVDFIITDPPYGGLVQYLDLSYIWLVWLKEYDMKYAPSFDDEITIKNCKQNAQEYSEMLTAGIEKLHNVLKPSGKIVFTFHNKDLQVWNVFLSAIKKSGFIVEKVIHQQNRRTGESNVSDPYGTSASDFYIRCVKGRTAKTNVMSQLEFEEYIVCKAASLISSRNEPTPYQILFNGLLVEFSEAGYELDNFDKNIKLLLDKHIGVVFEVELSSEKHGNLWWLKDEKRTDKSLTPLSKRVEFFIEKLFARNAELTEDVIFSEIYREFPSGLIPDSRKVKAFVQSIATKRQEVWTYTQKHGVA